MGIDTVSRNATTVSDCLSRLDVHVCARVPHHSEAGTLGGDPRANQDRSTRAARRRDVPHLHGRTGRRSGRNLARDALPALPFAARARRRDLRDIRREPGAARAQADRGAPRRRGGPRQDNRQLHPLLVVRGSGAAPTVRRRRDRPRRAGPRRPPTQRPARRAGTARRQPPPHRTAKGPHDRSRAHAPARAHELRDLPRAPPGRPLQPAAHCDAPTSRTRSAPRQLGDGARACSGIPRRLGSGHFREAATACFGTTEWPSEIPVPQASIEFEVADVAAAADELEAKGYHLLHGARTEPWTQITARLLSPEGLLVAVCYTPSFHDRSEAST